MFGMVQGVGFRPLVYRIAKKCNIKGTVRNIGGCVEIITYSSEEELQHFMKLLKEDKSGGSAIIKLEIEEISDPLIEAYQDFVITGSRSSSEISVIPPDLPVCPECERELKNALDRRYLNPFISCISCGPRYTIIEDLPYDRHTTTMKDFELCPACHKEYTSPESRRFHAQTISCNDCGPYLILSDRTENGGAGVERFNREALNKAVQIIKEGGILAVKGIGGYHLVCTPFLEETVQSLRRLKGREEKPFAVMFPSVLAIEKYCSVSEEERAYLQIKARPIVLLRLHSDSMAPAANKGSLYCGAFLPYTPLQILLTESCGPLIMTSANLSNQPVIREDKAILSMESPFLSGVLYHTRRIVRSVDDSVAKLIDGKPQLIRRSRGFVPYPVFIGLPKENQDGGEDSRVQEEQKTAPAKARQELIFAAGGDLKAAFCLYKEGKAVVSQYFGDLEEATVMQEYRKAYEDLTRLLRITPSYAVCDLHPNYHSARFAGALGLPLLPVQHHHAHIASVMAEHDLRKRVIGIAFDGTGYGTDGCIWGGEFLVCEGADYTRAAKLKYMPVIGGDQSMRDAAKTAACYLLTSGLSEYVTDERRDILQAALKNRINTVLTSSMGRLFDAVASILNIAQYNHYEGECASALEKAAVIAIDGQIMPEELSFAITDKDGIIELDPGPVLKALCRLRDRKNIASLALGFHYAVVDAAVQLCDRLKARYQCNTIALSGGVFQNTVLTQQALKQLRQKGYEVYLNMAVPPNDGAISLGQTYVALNKPLNIYKDDKERLHST